MASPPLNQNQQPNDQPSSHFDLLLDAIDNNQLQEVKTLLNTDNAKDLLETQLHPERALTIACRQKAPSAEMVKLLLTEIERICGRDMLQALSASTLRHLCNTNPSFIEAAKLLLATLEEVTGNNDLCRRIFELTDESGDALLANICVVHPNASIDTVQFLIETLAGLAHNDEALKKQLQRTDIDGNTLPMLIGRYCKDLEIVKCIVQTMIVKLGYKSFVEILEKKNNNKSSFLRHVSKNVNSKTVVRLMAGLLVEVGLFKEQYEALSTEEKELLKNKGGIVWHTWRPADEDCLVSPSELLLKAINKSVDDGTLDEVTNDEAKTFVQTVKNYTDTGHAHDDALLAAVILHQTVVNPHISAEMVKLLLTKGYHFGGLKLLKWQAIECISLHILCTSPSIAAAEQFVDTLEDLTGNKNLCSDVFEVTDQVNGRSRLAQVCVDPNASIDSVKFLIKTLADLEPDDRALKEHLELTDNDGSTLPMLIGRFCKDLEIVKYVVTTMIEKLEYDWFIDILQKKKSEKNKTAKNSFLKEVSQHAASRDVLRLMAGLLVEVGLFKEQYDELSAGEKKTLKDKWSAPTNQDLLFHSTYMFLCMQSRKLIQSHEQACLQLLDRHLLFNAINNNSAEMVKVLLRNSHRIGGPDMLVALSTYPLRRLCTTSPSVEAAKLLVDTLEEVSKSKDICRNLFKRADDDGRFLLAQVCVQPIACIDVVHFLIDTLVDLAPNDATLKEHLQFPSKDGSTLPTLIGEYSEDLEIVKLIVTTMIDKLGYRSFVEILHREWIDVNKEWIEWVDVNSPIEKPIFDCFLENVSKNKKSNVVRLMAGLLVEVGLFKEQYKALNDREALQRQDEDAKKALEALKKAGIHDECWQPTDQDLLDEPDSSHWHKTLTKIRDQNIECDKRIRALCSAIFNNSNVSGVEALRMVLPLGRLSAIDLHFLSHVDATNRSPFPLTPRNSSLAMKECLAPVFIDIAGDFWCSLAYGHKQRLLHSCAQDVPIGQRGDRDKTRKWNSAQSATTIRHCHPVLRMKSDDIFTVLYFNFGHTDTYSYCSGNQAPNFDPCPTNKGNKAESKLHYHFHDLVRDYLPDAIVVCEFRTALIPAPTFDRYTAFQTPANDGKIEVVFVRSDLESQEVKTKRNKTHDRFVMVDITKTLKDKQSGEVKSVKKLRLSGVHGQKNDRKPRKDDYNDLREQYFNAPNFLAIGDWNSYSHEKQSYGFANEITRQGNSMFVRGDDKDNFLVKRVPNQFQALLRGPPVSTSFDYAVSREPHLEQNPHPVLAVAMQW